jgi:hypothetical protein
MAGARRSRSQRSAPHPPVRRSRHRCSVHKSPSQQRRAPLWRGSGYQPGAGSPPRRRQRERPRRRPLSHVPVHVGRRLGAGRRRAPPGDQRAITNPSAMPERANVAGTAITSGAARKPVRGARDQPGQRGRPDHPHVWTACFTDSLLRQASRPLRNATPNRAECNARAARPHRSRRSTHWNLHRQEPGRRPHHDSRLPPDLSSPPGSTRDNSDPRHPTGRSRRSARLGITAVGRRHPPRPLSRR